MKIPAKGTPKQELLDKLQSFRKNDLDPKSKKIWAYAYDAGEAARQIGKEAYSMYLSENGLDPTVFPSLLRLENELVAMAASHLGGDENTVGNFTSGGTESILLAVKAARDHASAERPHITTPEMILPVTAHAAFHKAAKYFGVKIVPTPVGDTSFKADVAAMRAAITDNTILMVASAPSYGHGVIDPITELGQLALEKNLLLHVDACIGGFQLPYFKMLGAEVADFDFSVPGVTSMSMDYHKYAYCPKGASVVLYRDAALRKMQFFACADWTGYTVINAAVQSSKSGGPLAAAWAVLNFMGDEGYLAATRPVLEATNRIVEAIDAMADLRMMGRPEMSLIAFTSDTIDVFQLVDEMNLRGWYLQAQLAYGVSKQNIHLTVTPANAQTVDELLTDLRDAIEKVRDIPPTGLADSLGGMLGDIDLANLDDATFANLLGMVGVQGTQLPERMAGVNEVMNILPAQMREALLKAFFNQMFRYRPTDAD